MSDIIIKDLCKGYGEKTIIENLNASICEGAVTCIKGASGAGKTTFIRVLAGLETKDSGTIENVPEKIAFVFQEDRLLEDFSPISNITFATDKGLSKELIVKHLDELGLSDSLNMPIREFSGGMKRRIAIARAICYDADLIIMDEPFKGLDKDLKIKVMSYVKKYTKGKTVIIVSHDEEEISFMGGNTITISRT